MCAQAIRTGSLSPPRAANSDRGAELSQSRLLWALAIANAICVAAIVLIMRAQQPAPPFLVRFVPSDYGDLPGWSTSDPRPALAAFARSCAALRAFPDAHPMGGAGYAGSAAQWRRSCDAARFKPATPSQVRAYFETWFAPVAVSTPGSGDGLFTGYYEPEIAASLKRSPRYRIPVYGVPHDLITVELGRFRSSLAGEKITGRVANGTLVPYQSRGEIDRRGLASAPVLLYTDDPVSFFFAQIQGSGRARLPDGSIVRIAFDGTNGRPYTPIGRVLLRERQLTRKSLSLQSIRAWLATHPAEAQKVMEADESFVFFREAPLGDSSLGSPGTEGVPLTGNASMAVDNRIHPLGVPFFVASTVPDPDAAEPDHLFTQLLIAQDTGGAIRGAVRGDIFFGSGARAEALAGRMKSRGRLFVLLPKAVAAQLAPYKELTAVPE